jgi:hypothetical protein
MVLFEPKNSMSNADLAYQHALDRLSAVGFAALPERERDLAALWQVEAEVTNGGFVHYYSSAAGDTAFHAPEALARVGAMGKAAIVRTANALFGPAGPPSDRKERLAAVKALSAQDLATIDDLEKRYDDDPIDVDELVEGFAGQGN